MNAKKIESPLWMLKQEVINNGLCMGCGTCVAVCPNRCLSISELYPVFKGSCKQCGMCYDSCPGKYLPIDDLENLAFGKTRANEQDPLGSYESLFMGYASDPDIRIRGTSGGVVTALLAHLLGKGAITGAVAVSFDETKPWKPVPVICRTKDEILKAAKSKYSFTPQVAALRQAKRQDRLAFVGLPCQVQGLRKARLAGNAFVDNVKIIIGLLCASNFLPSGTENLIQHVVGLKLSDVSAIGYRDGTYPGGFAVSKKGYKAGHNGGEWYSHFVPIDYLRYLYAFRPYRCITCYDWSAELSDISVGDVYVYDKNRQKYSCVITRNNLGINIVAQAMSSHNLQLEAVQSIPMQDNRGYQYKKQGNRSFIHEARRHGLPTPSYPINA